MISKNKFIIILLILSLFLFLSGCYKINTEMKIYEDGTIETAMDIDMNGIRGAYSQMAGSTMDENQFEALLLELDTNYSKENICETIINSNSSEEGPSTGFIPTTGEPICESTEDYKARLSYPRIEASDKLTIEEVNGIKSFTLNLGKKNNSDSSDTNSPMGSSMMNAMDMEFKLTVYMPGQIMSSNVGEVSEDKKSVFIDLLLPMENPDENMIITSAIDLSETTIPIPTGNETQDVNGNLINFEMDSDTITIGAIVLVALILIIVIIAVVVKKKKGKRLGLNEIKEQTQVQKQNDTQTQPTNQPPVQNPQSESTTKENNAIWKGEENPKY